jgi:protein-disulfide isomerase
MGETVSTRARTAARQARNAKALAQQRARRRNRIVAAVGGLVILGLLVAIVVSLVNAAGSDPTPDAAADKPFVAPANATAAGAIPIGNAAAPVKVAIYLDYMCPFCGRFERANSDELERLVADGTIRIDLHVLSFLDKASSGTRYSTRTANAIATVADRAPNKLLAFNSALFARQPEEGSSGLSNDEIASLAGGAGVPQDVVNEFVDGTFEPWIAKVTKDAFASGITGTPTVKINEKLFQGDLYTAGPLTQAINAAKGQ